MKKFLSILIILLLLSGCHQPSAPAGGEEPPLSKQVTVLMYHHFEDTFNNYEIVAKDRFRDQLTTLKQEGYESVTLSQLIAFVEERAPLPEKPLLITMDDGYTSNLTLAAPILEELSMSATVFVIGINEGKTHYVHSGEPLSPPRFSYEEARPWVEKGVIEVQSHTYDLHQRENYGYSGREGVLPLAKEDAATHKAALLADCKQFREARAAKIETALTAIAYPFGFHTPEIDATLSSEFKVSFTTQPHLNTITQGDPSTLRMLGRVNASGEYDGEALLEKISSVPKSR